MRELLDLFPNARYGKKIYCARYVFLKIGRNTISVLCGNASYIACFTLLRKGHFMSDRSSSENGFRNRAHRQTSFHHPLFGRSRTAGAQQETLYRYDETLRRTRLLKSDTLIVFYSIRSERCRRSVSSKVSRRPAPSLSARPNFCHPAGVMPVCCLNLRTK